MDQVFFWLRQRWLPFRCLIINCFKKNNRTDHKTCHDFNFSRCTRPICRFPHKCNKCFKFGHNQWECLKQQSLGAPSLATTQRVNVPSSNTSMSGQVRVNNSGSSQLYTCTESDRWISIWLFSQV